MRIAVLLLLLTGAPLTAQEIRTYPIPQRIPNTDVVVRPKFPGLASPPIRIRWNEWPISRPGRLDRPAIPPLPIRLVSSEKTVTKPAPPTPIDCPADLPAQSRPVLKGVVRAAGFWLNKIEPAPFMTSTVELKHIAAKTAAVKLQKVSTVNATSVASRAVIVADPVRNAVHIIATKSQTKDLRRRLAELDRAPKQYIIQMVITEIGADGKKRILSRPQIMSLANRPAHVQIAVGSSQRLDLSVNIQNAQIPKGVARIVPSRHPDLKRKFLPQPHGIRVSPRSVTGDRATKFRSISVRRVVSPESSPVRLLTTVYAVADLVDARKGEAAKELIGVIRRNIRPKSWSGDASIQYESTHNVLIVRQTKAGQELIADLLASLRKLRERSRAK